MESFDRKIGISLPQYPPIQFVHRRSTADPDSFQLHLNDYVEIYVYISGDAGYIVEDRYLPLSPGDILLISPHTVHVPRLRCRCDYERFYLLIPLEIAADPAFSPLSRRLTHDPALSPKLNLSDAARREILGLLRRISDCAAKEPGDAIRLSCAGLFLQMLGLAAAEESSPAANTPLPESAGVPRLVLDILRYISEKPQEIGSVGDIAQHFFISLPYLSTLFHHHVGVSPGTYLRVKKIALAKKLLEAGHSVADACYACGFSDSSHFIRVFRQYADMTPGQYRSLRQKNR